MSILSQTANTALDRWAKPAAAKVPGSGGALQRAAQSATIISVVIIGVVALIGVLIFDQVYSAIPSAALEDGDGTPNEFGEAVDSVMSGFGNAMELIPVVLLVLVAALVIGVVQRMRQTNGGM